MTEVVFDLGTNIDREHSLVTALEHLADHFELLGASSVYSSEPVGMSNQPDFYNVALKARTDKSVAEIKNVLREIEDTMGRNRDVPKFGPRNIDIDLLLYGDNVDADSRIPHPQTRSQLFVVSPLAELLPSEKHPELGKSWSDLNRELLASVTDDDPGIKREFPLKNLPLGEKARKLFS